MFINIHPANELFFEGMLMLRKRLLNMFGSY